MALRLGGFHKLANSLDGKYYTIKNASRYVIKWELPAKQINTYFSNLFENKFILKDDIEKQLSLSQLPKPVQLKNYLFGYSLILSFCMRSVTGS